MPMEFSGYTFTYETTNDNDPWPYNQEKQGYDDQHASINSEGHLEIKLEKVPVEGSDPVYKSSRLIMMDDKEELKLEKHKQISIEFEGKMPKAMNDDGSMESSDETDPVPLWPAFWMMGTGYKNNSTDQPWPFCGEVDVMEWAPTLGNNRYSNAIHYDNNGFANQTSAKEGLSDLRESFHKYKTVLKRDNDDNVTISMYFDDELVHTYNIDKTIQNELFQRVDKTNSVIADEKHYGLLMNLALGGNYTGKQGEVIHVSYPNFKEATLVIKSVKVEKTDLRTLFFSEYAEGSSRNKYLEIFNPTDEAIDLSPYYALPSTANAVPTPGQHEFWNIIFEEGDVIQPKSGFIVYHPSADNYIKSKAEEIGGKTHMYLSNGNDGRKLVKGTEENYVVIDCIGDFQGDPGNGWDVAGVSEATKDHTLVRKSSVVTGNTNWDASRGTNAEDSEWIVKPQNEWTYLGQHTMITPAEPETESPLVGRWKLKPVAGSLRVGPNQGSGEWWSIDSAGVTYRGAFYDDEIVFNSDESFNNVMGTETIIEVWQGGSDAAGAPVAPHDGSNPATWEYTDGELTLNGVGAHVGLPKAVNGAELPNVAVPESRTYKVTFNGNDEVIFDIKVGGGWWRFIYVRSSETEQSSGLQLTVQVPEGTTSVRLTGPWWGWVPNGGPVASDNGDNTWTVTLDPVPTASMEYLWVVDNVQENLVGNAQNGELGDMINDGIIITDYWSYANRVWILNSGNVTNNVFDAANSEPEPEPELVFVGEPKNTATEDVLYTYTPQIRYDDKKVLTMTAVTLPTWLTPFYGTTLRGTPTQADVNNNPHPVKLVVTADGNDPVEQEFTIAITPVNDAPIFTSLPVTTAIAGLPYLYQPQLFDEDSNTLSVIPGPLPEWLTFESGVLSGTFPDDIIDDTNKLTDIELTVSDGELSTKQSFTIRLKYNVKTIEEAEYNKLPASGLGDSGKGFDLSVKHLIITTSTSTYNPTEYGAKTIIETNQVLPYEDGKVIVRDSRLDNADDDTIQQIAAEWAIQNNHHNFHYHTTDKIIFINESVAGNYILKDNTMYKTGFISQKREQVFGGRVILKERYSVDFVMNEESTHQLDLSKILLQPSPLQLIPFEFPTWLKYDLVSGDGHNNTKHILSGKPTDAKTQLAKINVKDSDGNTYVLTIHVKVDLYNESNLVGKQLGDLTRDFETELL
jgi:hypothetical protein